MSSESPRQEKMGKDDGLYVRSAHNQSKFTRKGSVLGGIRQILA